MRANSLPVTVLEQWVLALMFLQNGGQNSKMKQSIKKAASLYVMGVVV